MTDSEAPEAEARPISTGSRLSFRRAAVEFAVIAIGVFTALAAEAAWSERQERADEKEALVQLRGEFEANAARLDTAEASHRQSLDATYDLLALTQGLGEAQTDRAPAVLIFYMGRVWTYDPVRGGLNSLIASGRLGILRSDSLRIALAAWPDLVNDLAENEREEWDHIYEDLQPYLIEKGVRTDVLLAGRALRRVADEDFVIDVSPVLSDPVFAEMVASRIAHLHDLLDEVQTVRSSIEDIVRLIEASGVSAEGAPGGSG